MAWLLCSVLLAGCSSTSVQRAGEGAVVGAAAGAVGSMFTAAIFGGDIGEAAARGAAWGAGAGAVSGAVAGSAEHQRKQAEAQRRQEAELARLRAEIGEDAFNGLAALTERKHEVALAYARTAMRSDDPEFALAGYWLEALVYRDSGDETNLTRSVPALVQRDPQVGDVADAELILDDLHEGLDAIRAEFGVGG